MKYKCLVLDHDDTVVNSSYTIHYPSFIEYLKDYRPHLVSNYTFESFLAKNFTPGILELLTGGICQVTTTTGDITFQIAED